VSGRVINSVVSTGQNQQGFTIRADDGGHGLACDILRVIGETGIERDKTGTCRRSRRDSLATVGNKLLGVQPRNENGCQKRHSRCVPIAPTPIHAGPRIRNWRTRSLPFQAVSGNELSVKMLPSSSRMKCCGRTRNAASYVSTEFRVGKSAHLRALNAPCSH